MFTGLLDDLRRAALDVRQPSMGAMPAHDIRLVESTG